MRMCLLLEFHSCYKSDSDSFNAGYIKRIAGNKKHTMVKPLVWKEVCHCVFFVCVFILVPYSNGTLSDQMQYAFTYDLHPS